MYVRMASRCSFGRLFHRHWIASSKRDNANTFVTALAEDSRTESTRDQASGFSFKAISTALAVLRWKERATHPQESPLVH